MLASYLKLAWKVLGRRKFFTFVSLFGVGFTLMVLVVGVAILDHSLGAQPPEVHQARTLTVRDVRLSGKGTSSNAHVGRKFFDDHLRDLPGAERISYFTDASTVPARAGAGSIAVKGTDGPYWKILQFQFLEGGPFGDDDVRDRRMVAVVSRTTADRYFGAGPALGKIIEIDAQRFQVVGVVADVSRLRDVPYADVWRPYTTEKGIPPRPVLLGNGVVLVLMRDAAAIPEAKRVLLDRLAQFESPNPRRWNQLHAPLDTHFEAQARGLFGNHDEEVDHSGKLLGALVLLAACFLMLPTVNLVNLNVSRILERGPEIGVRKSFGATGLTLVGQFLVENLVLTMLGGLLGLALAPLVLRALSRSTLLPHAQLQMSVAVALWGLLLAVVFGVVSGVYPAWRMSRLNPVLALKGGER
jgi:putative ABC transport system permease protein